jgi:hypothetical protein
MNCVFNIVLGMMLVLLATAYAGCTPVNNTDSIWIGHSEKELVEAMGIPDATIVLPDGRKMITWTSFESPSQVVACRRSYTIGFDGNVEDFASSNCAPKQMRPVFIRPRRGF